MGVITKLAENPWTFHLLRKIPEFNYRQTKSRIGRRLNGRAPVVDIGCGTAEFCRMFEPRHYLGIDISPRYLQFARKRNPQYSFILASGADLCLPSNSFPQALINGVLHHLDERLALTFLHEAHRILKHRGVLLLIEDIEAANSGSVSKLVHRLDMGAHIREVEGYERLLARLFHIEEFSTYYSGTCHYGMWLLRK